jgi:hypothetical protein
MLPFLSGGMIGIACGMCLGPSQALPAYTRLAGDAVYRGQPARFWIAQLEDYDPSFRQSGGSGSGADWIERRQRHTCSCANAYGSEHGGPINCCVCPSQAWPGG